MVQVASSRGGTVTVVMTGIIDTINRLRDYRQFLPTSENIMVVKVADFVKSEVQESIIGNRGEPKSVDTGAFANSLDVIPKGDKEFAVTTDIEYAKFLEYGTSKMDARHHFMNTVFRVGDKVKDIAKVEMEDLKKKAFK